MPRRSLLPHPAPVMLAAACAMLAVAGCAALPGGGGPRSAPAPQSTAAPPSRAPGSSTAADSASEATARQRALVARAEHTHEYPTPAGRQSVFGGWRSPAQAVAVFAATYINWTATTVSDRLGALAQVSVGQARAAMSLAASETARDVELHRGKIANQGTVEAVAPLRGGRHQYAVVTRERTTAAQPSSYQGLQPVWHVTLATVTRVTGGLWVLSAWQPES